MRILERLNVIPIRDRAGRVYKAYKGDANLCFEAWKLPNGRWVSDIVSMFDAHQPGYRSPVKDEHPTARKVLRLYKGDLLALDGDNGRQIVRVVKFSANGSIQLAAHNEGGNLKRRDAKPVENDYFKYISSSASGLRDMAARQVRVDELGRCFDPGPPA